MSTELNTFHGISLHVSVAIAPEHIDEFLSHFKVCFDAVTAEPECIFFEVFHDAEHPGHFRWVEDWNKDVEVRYISELLSPTASRVILFAGPNSPNYLITLFHGMYSNANPKTLQWLMKVKLHRQRLEGCDIAAMAFYRRNTRE